MIRSMLEDPSGFRQRMFTIMPRVFFVLLPVFAGVVALFYRKRHFPTALVFAVHLHAFAFIVYSISEALKFAGNPHLAERIGAVMAVIFAIYALKSFRAVYGGGWPMTIAKAMHRLPVLDCVDSGLYRHRLVGIVDVRRPCERNSRGR